MDTTDYEFNVEVWLQDNEWYYSVIQSFDDGEEIEAIAYGTADTPEEAFRCAGQEVIDFFTEGE